MRTTTTELGTCASLLERVLCCTGASVLAVSAPKTTGGVPPTPFPHAVVRPPIHQRKFTGCRCLESGPFPNQSCAQCAFFYIPLPTTRTPCHLKPHLRTRRDTARGEMAAAEVSMQTSWTSGANSGEFWARRSRLGSRAANLLK
jgi:hypothetical protein